MRCAACGAELAPNDRFCGECGAPRTPLPPAFAEAERRFVALRARYRSGELDETAYDAALRELVVQDDSGYWMLGADSGAWYWYDGQRWVERDPPAVATPASRPAGVPSVPLVPPAAKASPQRRWWIALLVGVPLLCIAAATIWLFGTDYGALARHSLAVALNPEDPEPYRRRAATYGELGAYDRAAADYTRAIGLSPDDAWLYTQRSIAYSVAGRSEEAIADLDRVLALDPEDCLAYLWRARLRQERGELDRARADYQQVLSVEDEACFSQQEAAQALAELGASPAPPTAMPASVPTPMTASPPTSAASPTPSPTVRVRELLYYDDFDTSKEPTVNDVGQVRWEGGELRLLASMAGRNAAVFFTESVASDFRLYVTARPVRLYPGSAYAVKVRSVSTGSEAGGYWFTVRGDGTCQACVEGNDESLDCPVDWRPCPVISEGANEITVEAIGSSLRFAVNEDWVANLSDATYRSGMVALQVSNSAETTGTLVAFDDLALFEP